MALRVFVGGPPSIKKVGSPEFFDLTAAGDAAVGGRIRAYRNMSGLSQAELAELATQVLADSGNPLLANERVTQTDITRLERDASRARVFLLSAVCTVLRKRINDLLEAEVVDIDDASAESSKDMEK